MGLILNIHGLHASYYRRRLLSSLCLSLSLSSPSAPRLPGSVRLLIWAQISWQMPVRILFKQKDCVNTHQVSLAHKKANTFRLPCVPDSAAGRKSTGMSAPACYPAKRAATDALYEPSRLRKCSRHGVPDTSRRHCMQLSPCYVEN